jgi:hypothetical protein
LRKHNITSALIAGGHGTTAKQADIVLESPAEKRPIRESGHFRPSCTIAADGNLGLDTAGK